MRSTFVPTLFLFFATYKFVETSKTGRSKATECLSGTMAQQYRPNILSGKFQYTMYDREDSGSKLKCRSFHPAARPAVAYVAGNKKRQVNLETIKGDPPNIVAGQEFNRILRDFTEFKLVATSRRSAF